MTTIACLLRSGGDFNADHVKRLQRQCRVIPHTRFVCLSDVEVPCERIPLAHDWVRWWGQCELFRPGLFDGPVVYMDLDTTVLRDPGITVQPGEFWSLYWQGRNKSYPTSGLMAWWGDFSRIYDGALRLNKNRLRWVNEGIFPHVQAKRLQDQVAGIYSFKRDVSGKTLPADASIVFFHGTPRPWQVRELVA